MNKVRDFFFKVLFVPLIVYATIKNVLESDKDERDDTKN